MTDTETPSTGLYAKKYYSGGEIDRSPTRKLHPTSRLATFHIISAEKARAAHDGTTEAVEMTLQITGARAQDIAAQAQPGLYFAYEPKNDRETVDTVFSFLKPVAEGERITVPVHSDRMGKDRLQSLLPRDVLTGLVDLSRPTEQLVNLLAKRAEEAGTPLPKADPKETAACYALPELLASRPNLLTLEELYANQPPMKSRPYTISDFDREKAQIKILVSGVSAKLAAGDPFGIKGHGAARSKNGGISTGMLLDLSQGNGGNPVSDYPINGYLLTELPRLMFPGIVERTEALGGLTRNDPKWDAHVQRFENARPDQTLYFLGTGSGMAPYMSVLRELSRRQKAGEKPYPAKIVVINGGRHPEDELFAKECRQYVKDGLISAYHVASSATGTEKIVTLKNGEPEEREAQGVSTGGRYYIQDALEANYGRDMDKNIREGKALVYVCGTQGALRGVFGKWPEAFRSRPGSIQHTASLPTRFYEGFWKSRNEATSHREPLPPERRAARQDGAWTKRVLNIVEIREGRDARPAPAAVQR